MNDRKEPTPAPDPSLKPEPPPPPPRPTATFEDEPTHGGDHFGYKPVQDAPAVFREGMRTGFIPIKLRDFREAWQFAAVLVKSKLLPADIDEPGKALAIMLTGQELGIPPMAALRMIHIVEGRPSLAAELMLAKFRQHGGRYVIKEHTEKACEITFTRDDESYTERWTIEDAQKAGLLDRTAKGKLRDNWTRYPKRMLLWRTVDNGLSILAPDIFAGLHTQAYAWEAVEYEETDVGQGNLDSRIDELKAAIEEEQSKGDDVKMLDEHELAEEFGQLCKACGKPLSDDNAADEETCLDCAVGT